MIEPPQSPFVLPLADPAADLGTVGGKGASLAALAAAGLPIPDGFHVSTEAYREATGAGLRERILAILARTDPDRPETLDEAATRIAEVFAEQPIPDDVAEAIRTAYAKLGDEVAVAVRSSATAEDLPGMSFAGQQDTYLNVRGQDAVLDAVLRCWSSLWTARAVEYRARHGIAPEDVAIGVLVQELVEADAAGVVFTADPMTGARDRLLINATWGLGEALVGGAVTPDSLVVARDGEIVERRLGAKTTMTVCTDGGTREVPVDEALRDSPVLDQRQATELAALAVGIEARYEQPVDIEWVVRAGEVFVIQARPVTGLPAHQSAVEYNDSFAGDYLWTNGNVGEAIPDVMTPCTWSLARILMSNAMAATSLPGYRGYGNIGGRFYLNLSITATVASVVGTKPEKFVELTVDTFGKLPEGMTVPLLPLSRWKIARLLLPMLIRVFRRIRTNTRRLPGFLDEAPRRCERLRSSIRDARDRAELAGVWRHELEPFFDECGQMLEAATRQGGRLPVTARNQLRGLVGETDASTLFAGLQDGGRLASLGPVVGIAKLARGEIDRDTFAREYGHRGPHEFEVSQPRPAEDPEWIGKLVAGFGESMPDVAAMLESQQRERDAAWQRFAARYPRKVKSMRKKLALWARIARDREAARSEVTRVFAVLRAFVLRAGELTGHGTELFFLSIQEIVAVLDGDETALASVPARRALDERYRALPPYPAVIRGRFDPFQWAADENRRGDFYDGVSDAGATVADGVAKRAEVTGFAGAAGVVEGSVRVIATVEEGAALLPGEILVTTVTNIGWTPLFPRAGAVVTDVGAPLSHAAIVARELGIPAVVGCGDATMRLRTGDRVRVDGQRGAVRVLAPT